MLFLIFLIRDLNVFLLNVTFIIDNPDGVRTFVW